MKKPTQHQNHHMGCLRNLILRLHGVLALTCNWRENSEFETKAFGFGSLFC